MPSLPPLPELPPLPAEAQALLARAEQRAVDGLDGPGAPVVWRRWGPMAAGAAAEAPATQATPVVLLHGGSGAWNHWLRNIEALAAHRAVLVPDLPGYGASASPPPATPPEGLADRLAATLPPDWRGQAPDGAPRPVAVVGFSFGGIVAGCWAARHPAQVRQLVLVGAVGLGILRRGDRPLRPWRYETDAQALQEIHRHNLATLMLHRPEAIDPLALALQDWNVRQTRYVSKHASRGDELAEALAQVQAPVAGIWGREDVTADRRLDEVQALLQLASPAAPFEVVDGAGHWVAYEAPQAFNAALARLLV